MKHALSLFVAATLTATGPALAGSLADPVVDAPVMVPAPAKPSMPNWTGFYLGSEVGYLSMDTNLPGVDGDDPIAGFTAGYDYDFGSFVLGTAVDYDWTSLNLTPAVQAEKILRVKVRGGLKMGRGLAYATGGYTNLDTNIVGDVDGFFVGGGYDYMVGEHLTIGGELLYHDYDNFTGTPVGAEATTLAVRTVFKF